MWNPFKNIITLVPLLLIIQIGYTIAKAIENPRSCNDSTENDPQLKRSDENYSGVAEIPDSEDPATRKSFSKANTTNEYGYANDFASHPNTLPQKLPLVNNVNVSAYVEKRDTDITKMTTTKAPLQQPIYYKAIDPKYLIVSGLSFHKPNKNMTNVRKTEKTIIDFNETTSVDNSNITEVAKVLNIDEAYDIERKEIIENDFGTDVTNIRELREHLLDHLLDYFLNIIKEENFIRNDTRKKNDNDRMKVEEKLRNYYDPHHLDMLLLDDDDDDDDDEDYEDINLDSPYYNGNNDSEEDLPDNVKQNEEIGKENKNNITLNSLAGHIDNNTQETYTSPSPENLKIQVLDYKENLNISSPVDVSFYFNVSEPTPVTLRYVNEKENNTSTANTTEKSFDNSDNVITATERSTSNETLNDFIILNDETLNDEADDTGALNHSDEAITDRIHFIYDNGAYTIKDFSYEDFNDSVELQVVKNVNVPQDNQNPIDIITEDGRRKNKADKEKSMANSTLNVSKNPNKKNSLNTRNNSTNSTNLNKKETPPKELGILDLPNKLANNISTYDEDNLPDNLNKKPMMKTNLDIKTKLKSNKKCGNIDSKLINKKTNKQDCRKSIILNLKINLF